MDGHVLVFEVGGRRFGLPAAAVREVVRAVAVRPLPGAPAAVEGVIDVRGRLVPVLDARGRLGMAPRRLDPGDHFILAERGGRPVVLHVDRAVELAEADEARAEEVRDVVPGVRQVRWAAQLGEGLLLIHDLEAFLDGPESASLEAALARLAAEGRP